MSFKERLLDILRKYDLNSTSLSRRLGYSSGEKILRLIRDEENSPSVQIIQDILKEFPEINPRWLITGEEEIIFEEPRAKYGYCKECIKKEGVIEYQQKELKQKNQEIESLKKELSELGERLRQTASKAS